MCVLERSLRAVDSIGLHQSGRSGVDSTNSLGPVGRGRGAAPRQTGERGLQWGGGGGMYVKMITK